MTLPTATLARTHDVFNQSTPWADVNPVSYTHLTLPTKRIV